MNCYLIKFKKALCVSRWFFLSEIVMQDLRGELITPLFIAVAAFLKVNCRTYWRS
ncbi:hypothetical protein HMPREF0201_00909 [Cedecea davisae DSM 4568]|uniref:Uncharacterized protein n=1 Tax=Cedecea davisae DSM 4568 TaxID=566551 RepID=S3J1Y4_9ENTR|nr:hypothetical protein HMPREF0201_00909 [Cedecea davisae DSM 4568]